MSENTKPGVQIGQRVQIKREMSTRGGAVTPFQESFLAIAIGLIFSALTYWQQIRQRAQADEVSRAQREELRQLQTDNAAKFNELNAIIAALARAVNEATGCDGKTSTAAKCRGDRGGKSKSSAASPPMMQRKQLRSWSSR